ncbi:MAG: hypothetical protein H0X42_04960 [Solirubrobacterales bacterium]|nr:hypothetical protein [Solirubrobacterales bacterium]
MSYLSRGRPRSVLALLAVAALTLGLAACGGGGSTDATGEQGNSTSSTSTSATTAPGTAPKPTPAQAAAETAAERRQAGKAAPFVSPKADNSVPTFGSEGAASERVKAEAGLKAYLRARAGEDWATACRYLAASTREGFEKLAKGKGLSCAQVLGALSKGADLSDPLTGSLLALRIEGENAFALFYGPGHQQYIVPMAHEGNTWKPTQAAPIVYPPGAPPTTSP